MQAKAATFNSAYTQGDRTHITFVIANEHFSVNVDRKCHEALQRCLIGLSSVREGSQGPYGSMGQK
jgi:hypothetical protein